MSEMRSLRSKCCAIGLLWLSLVSAAHAATILYSYDALNRLTGVVYPDGTTVAYTYDAAGNRLNRTVVSAPVTLPALTGITPNSGGQGLTLKVNLIGSNFVSPATVDAGAGITVSSVAVVNSTLIEAVILISPNASLGNRNITVTTAGGQSNSVTFSVIPLLPPTLSGITPSSGGQGLAVSVILSGTNLFSSTTVDAGSGISVSNLTVSDSTSATATLAILANATLGPHNVFVSTTAGTSSAAIFTVISTPATRRGGQVTSQD